MDPASNLVLTDSTQDGYSALIKIVRLSYANLDSVKSIDALNWLKLCIMRSTLINVDEDFMIISG